MQTMKWSEALEYLREYNRRHGFRQGNTPDKYCVMVAVLKPEAMIDKNADEDHRTYTFNNNNKAVLDGMIGYSIFATNKGTKGCERIEHLMDKDVEYCYVKSEDTEDDTIDY